MNCLQTFAAAGAFVLTGACAHAATVAGHDVVFLLDGSGSVESAGFELGKDFIATVTQNELDPTNSDNRVAALTFGADTTTHYSFGDLQDTAAFTTVVDALTWPSSSTSDVRGALDDVVSFFDTAPAASGTRSRHLFLITDGIPSPSPTAPYDPCEFSATANGIAAAATRDAVTGANIEVWLIGIGPVFDETKLECLMDDPVAFTFDVTSQAGLDYVAENGVLPPTAVVPVPAALPLLGGGLLALGLMRRRRGSAPRTSLHS